MGYPFEDNPLDAYLNQLFALKVDELDVMCLLDSQDITGEQRADIAKQLATVRKKIAALSDGLPIKPRAHDVFLSGPELAVERFKREHPEPPAYVTCSHSKQQLTKKVFGDGSIHVVSQCVDCGSSRGARAKGSLVLADLPSFDSTIANQTNEYRTWWNNEKYRIYFEARREGNEAPDFDHEAFEVAYQALDREPCWQNCKHEQIELRLRIYNPTNSAAVEQCTDCGMHLSSVKKPLGWEGLPPFDHELEKIERKEWAAWSDRRYQARKLAEAQHRQEVRARIAKGEIAVRDNSKFGNYYDSDQWARTRERILTRDDRTCQACGASAECVHHIVYDRLGAENDIDLISLCNGCHEEIHREQRALHNLYRMPPCDIRRLRPAG